MSDPFYVYRPLLDLLGRSEGTDKGRGYNETLAYGAYSGGDRNLTGMTLAQIDELQTAMLAHPANRLNSSAAGRYQIVRKTLRAIRESLKLSTSTRYDANLQDRLACYLLGSRGIDRWLTGKLSQDALINELAKEWASLPNTRGVGHYGGQRASVPLAYVRQVLVQVKTRHSLALQTPATPSVGGKPKTGGGVWAALVAIIKAIFGGRK